MQRITYSEGEVVEERNAVGLNWVITNAEGIKIGEVPLAPEELARFQAEGQLTPDAQVVIDLNAASSLDGVKAALIERFGG